MSEEIQAKLAELQGKGWTLANIAREIDQAKRTVEAWNQGKRTPANLKSVLMHLNILAKRKRIPPRKCNGYKRTVATGGSPKTR